VHSDTPYHVEAKNSSYRCVRLADGRFHLVRPGPLAHLFYGGDHILVSEALAAVLRDTCSHCLDLRRTELVQVATGETFGIYCEVLPRDEFTPEGLDTVRSSGFHAWHFRRCIYLFHRKSQRILDSEDLMTFRFHQDSASSQEQPPNHARYSAYERCQEDGGDCANSLSPSGLRPLAEGLSPFPKRLKCGVPGAGSLSCFPL
jgi:hypothetical protein